MSTAESAPQGAEDEVCRVLDLIATCPEGASYFTVTTELGIARTRAVSILEKLHRDGKLSYDCKTKMYFSRLELMKTKEGSPPAQKDRLAGYGRKIDAGLIMTPDPEADRAAPDRFPKEEKKNKCQYCGKVVERYLWQHENYCKENPDHKTPPGAAFKKRKEQQSSEPEKARSLLEAVVNDPYSRESEPSPPPEKEPMMGTIVEVPSIKEEPEPAPAEGGIITQPTLEVLGESASGTPLPAGSSGVNFTINVKGTPEQTLELLRKKNRDMGGQDVDPVLVEDSRGILVPAPDPLALFAQQHRVRVGKEIRKLKKVERKLRRRAAAAEAMAERVKAARKTKERELRRFEKELAGASS